MYCKHPNMISTARTDYCPDCKYEFYYGDAHAADPEARKSKEINAGRNAPESARCIYCGCFHSQCLCDYDPAPWDKD